MNTPVRILLCDDDTLVRIRVRHILEQTPDLQVVGEATGGEQAVALALELKPDLVLMDVSMPDLNGIEATRRILAAAPNLRVLALSADFQDEIVDRMLSAGAWGYLFKGGPSAELLEAIRTIMSGRRFVSAFIVE